jgi:hypothetical protein
MPLLDNRVEHVIRFAIENDGRAGIQVDIDFVELRFALAQKRCQFMRRQRIVNILSKALPRPTCNETAHDRPLRPFLIQSWA